MTGSSKHILVHRYGPKDENVSSKKIYIQSSLHADEVPGLLVSHHLIRLLDEASRQNRIRDTIVIVPYANPIGLSQYILGSHIGRFSLSTGVNFNRDWPDLTSRVTAIVRDKLVRGDSEGNVKLIRDALKETIRSDKSYVVEKVLKRVLYELACDADVVLDLHCDTGKMYN